VSQSAIPSTRAAILLAASMLFAACGSAATTISADSTSAGATPPSRISAGATSPSAAGSAVATASPPPTAASSPAAASTGFPFAADDIVAFYESQAYACTAQKPSTKALGYVFRTCQKVDAAGRTLLVGVVTDAKGGLADAFASVQGTAAESFLSPVDALPPLAGFLGVMLGDDQGTAALPWLAGHLGDTYSETRVGEISLATYTATPDDHSRLYVEVANQEYLDASPAPSS
jgi:hypothetical protein